MEYKGFTANIEFDSDDNILVGRVIGIDDIISFHAGSVELIEQEFHNAIDSYIERCEKIGKNPHKSYSGRFNLRMTSEQHKKLALEAELKNVSLNELVLQKLFNKDERTSSFQTLKNRIFERFQLSRSAPDRESSFLSSSPREPDFYNDPLSFRTYQNYSTMGYMYNPEGEVFNVAYKVAYHKQGKINHEKLIHALFENDESTATDFIKVIARSSEFSDQDPVDRWLRVGIDKDD